MLQRGTYHCKLSLLHSCCCSVYGNFGETSCCQWSEKQRVIGLYYPLLFTLTVILPSTLHTSLHTNIPQKFLLILNFCLTRTQAYTRNAHAHVMPRASQVCRMYCSTVSRYKHATPHTCVLRCFLFLNIAKWRVRSLASHHPLLVSRYKHARTLRLVNATMYQQT